MRSNTLHRWIATTSAVVTLALALAVNAGCASSDSGATVRNSNQNTPEESNTPAGKVNGNANGAFEDSRNQANQN